MQSEPCESKLLMVIFFICYCIFGVYLVTGTKNPDIRRRNVPDFKINFFITTALGVLYKMGKPNYLDTFIGLTSSPRHQCGVKFTKNLKFDQCQ
jgi:hypothetical protein